MQSYPEMTSFIESNAMAKWKRKTLRLKDTHGWQATPGCKIFVADKGAVRFDFPQHWITQPTADSIQFLDRRPPDDDCRLAVSYQRLPVIDWSGAPLADMLRQVVANDPRDLIPTMEVASINRADLMLVWTEGKFIDPQASRTAYGRIAVGIGGNIQVLLTFEYWAEDAERFTWVWDTVLQSLQVCTYIPDPTRGPRPQ
jgi:hypothetical protein